MSRAWMPLYIGDYLRDTGHLNTFQHGAYLLLIMHYWEHGELPTDDASLSRICRCSLRQWKSNCLAIARLFLDGWKHKRIDDELEKQHIISEKRAMAGYKGGMAGRGKTNIDRQLLKAIAKQTGHQSQSHRITSTESLSEEEAAEEASEHPSVARMRQRIASRRA